jgi:hypothetical protein
MRCGLHQQSQANVMEIKLVNDCPKATKIMKDASLTKEKLELFHHVYVAVMRFQTTHMIYLHCCQITNSLPCLACLVFVKTFASCI